MRPTRSGPRVRSRRLRVSATLLPGQGRRSPSRVVTRRRRPLRVAGHRQIAHLRRVYRTRTRACGRVQPAQARDVSQARYDHHLRDTATDDTAVKPAAGSASDSGRQQARAPRALHRMRSRRECRQVRRGVRTLPGRTHATHGHGHRRHRPHEPDQREHPQGARATIIGTPDTDHRITPSSASRPVFRSSDLGRRFTASPAGWAAVNRARHRTRPPRVMGLGHRLPSALSRRWIGLGVAAPGKGPRSVGGCRLGPRPWWSSRRGSC